MIHYIIIALYIKFESLNILGGGLPIMYKHVPNIDNIYNLEKFKFVKLMELDCSSYLMDCRNNKYITLQIKKNASQITCKTFFFLQEYFLWGHLQA